MINTCIFILLARKCETSLAPVINVILQQSLDIQVSYVHVIQPRNSWYYPLIYAPYILTTPCTIRNSRLGASEDIDQLLPTVVSRSNLFVIVNISRKPFVHEKLTKEILIRPVFVDKFTTLKCWFLLTRLNLVSRSQILFLIAISQYRF